MFAMMLHSSCKQEAPEVKPDRAQTIAEIGRGEACGRVSVLKGFSSHTNIVNLFECLSWNNQYPHLNTAIKNIKAESWNQIFTPFDKILVENSARRDRFIHLIRDLDTKGGVDDLSFIFKSMMNRNIYDTLNTVFVCATNPSAKGCEARGVTNISKQEIKSIIAELNITPEYIFNVSEILNSVTRSLRPREKRFRNENLKLVADNEFKSKRVGLLNQLAADFAGKEIDDSERNFYTKLLVVSKGGTDKPWIHEWLRDPKIDEDTFDQLVKFPIYENPNFALDMKSVYQGIDDNVECNEYKEGRHISLKLKDQMIEFMTEIHQSGHGAFFNLSHRTVNDLLIASEVCPQLREFSPKDSDENSHRVDMLKMVTTMASFLSEKSFFDLTKFMLHVAVDEALPGQEDILYLMKMTGEDSVQKILDLSKSIAEVSPDFFKFVFHIVKDINHDFYLPMASVIGRVLDKSNEESLKVLGKLWGNLTVDDRNFIFSIMDQHYKEGTNYILLLDFYSKMMNEVKEFYPQLVPFWMGDDVKVENTYNALADIVSNFSGEYSQDTLNDFARFFDKDQIFKVISILVNGVDVPRPQLIGDIEFECSNNADNNGYLDCYLSQISHTPFEIVVDPIADQEVKKKIACIKALAEGDASFYKIIQNLPEECEDIDSNELTYKLLGWMNDIGDDYCRFRYNNSDACNDPNRFGGLLDRRGALSNAMLNSSMATSKILDDLFEKTDSDNKRISGVQYLMDIMKWHMYEIPHKDPKDCQNSSCKGFSNLFEDLVFVTNDFFQTSKTENVLFRNDILREYTEVENFNQSSDFIDNVFTMASDYGDWLEDGGFARSNAKTFREKDPKYTCENFLNQNIGDNLCPSKESVKGNVKQLMKLFTRHNDEKGTKSFIEQLIMAMIPEHGINIPYEAKESKQRTYVLDLKKTLKMIYDLSDRSLEINTRTYEYRSSDNTKVQEPMTTNERVETTIRSVAFDEGYQGVIFMNGAARAKNYEKEAKKKRKLLKTCTKVKPLYKIACGKKMSKNERRLAKNSIATFSGLIDSSKYLGHGDFLQAFLTVAISSSKKKATKETMLFGLLPYIPKKSELRAHNAKVITRIAGMAGYSNIARFVSSRVGRTTEEFTKFLASESFNRINTNLLKGFDLEKSQVKILSIFEKLQTVKSSDGTLLHDDVIDWVTGLDYHDSRIVENTIYEVMTTLTYLGDECHPDSANCKSSQLSKYKSNNIFKLFNVLDLTIEMWPYLRDAFPKDAKLVDTIKSFNNFITFFNAKLKSNTYFPGNVYHKLLNDTFVVLDNVLLESRSTAQVAGIELSHELVKSEAKSKFMINTLRNAYQYIDRLHYSLTDTGSYQITGARFKEVASNISRILDNEDLDFQSLRQYLAFTTLKCVEKDGSFCEENFHYDELAGLTAFLTTKHKNTNQSRFIALIETVLVDEYESIMKLIDRFSPIIEIKRSKKR